MALFLSPQKLIDDIHNDPALTVVLIGYSIFTAFWLDVFDWIRILAVSLLFVVISMALKSYEYTGFMKWNIVGPNPKRKYYYFIFSLIANFLLQSIVLGVGLLIKNIL